MPVLSRLAASAAAVLIAVTVLGACSAEEQPTASVAGPSELMTKHDLADLDARAVIERLEARPLDERDASLRATVTPTEVTLTEEGSTEVVLDLSDDDFYLSVAPFASTTHDCVMHSLTGCRGELRNEPVTITATDRSSGAVISSTRTRTQDNGFAGIWLPRDRDLTIAVRQGKRSGSADVSTGADAPTCLTTIQLT